MPIKYNNSDLQKLQRTVDNFNAKVRRAAARGVEGLPGTIRIRDVRADIVNRADFNRTVNELQRFSRRGAERSVLLESGVKVTAWELREFKRSLAIVNVQRKKQLEKLGALDATSRGKPVGLPRGQMHSVRMNELQPRKSNPHKARSRSEFEALFRSVRQNSKAGHFTEGEKRLRDNYMSGLEKNFGTRGKQLAELLKKQGVKQVVERMYQDQEGWITYISDPVQADAVWSDLLQVWGDVPGVDQLGTTLQAADGLITI